MDYYILSLTHNHLESLVFQRPNNSGYTYILELAGKYTREQVEAKKYYYDNGKDTKAIPCHLLDEFVVRIVPSDVNIDKILGKDDNNA